MSKDVAIKIQGVKKKYRLGQIGGGSLQADLQSWWARKRGKEDPNTKIGTDQRLIGQTFMALTGIDLTVYQGEALGIIGRNGAGKSTLLKLLSRVTAPTEGTIDIYGRITSMLEVGTGFHPEMTGRENVYMNGAILGMTKAEIDSKMNQIIEFSEVGDFIDTPVKRYSSGMYVKLAFSVAAHLDSEIMIMDEVLAVGDMAFQQKCLNKMREEATTDGKTILYVSHNMNTIRQLCNRCIVLDQGKIVFDGDVEKAISLYMQNSSYQRPYRDYVGMQREHFIKNDILRMTHVKYVGKEDCIYKRNEPMKIEFEWENHEDIVDAGLRVEILSDDGTPIATGVNYDLYSGKKGETVTADLTYDLSLFAPGSYHTRYTFFQKNMFGNGQDIDYGEGMDLIIDDPDGKLVWRAGNWGHIILPEAKITISSNLNHS